jgi:AcrR family transcriptional regulator
MTDARPLRSQPTRDRILTAARQLFAEHGYDRTTIRLVAAAAAINPSLVMRYYGSKEGLFAAAATFDLRLPDLAALPRPDVGRALVRHFLARWEGPGSGDELPSLLRAAVTHEVARERAFAIYREQIASAIARLCPPATAEVSAALVATQIVGLALTRYVIRLPPVLALDAETIIERVGTTIQSYLTE